jgi:hypothetical protein
MLKALERRIVAILADTVTARTHLTVAAGPPPAAGLAAGNGRIVARIAELASKPAFISDATRELREVPATRRILRLATTVRVVFQLRPATAAAADVDDARNLLLEDMSIVSHALADQPIASGDAFDVPDDEGFRVLGFVLDRGSGTLDAGSDPLSGELQYACDVEIWPPAATDAASLVAGISTVITTVPVDGMSAERVVSAGRAVAIDLSSLPIQRPAAAGQGATPLRFALRVLSPAPPAARGTISGGVAGAEPGVTVLPAASPDTSFVYQAPALANGGRTEYVAVHYATPDSKAGVFLGAVAVRIRSNA